MAGESIALILGIAATLYLLRLSGLILAGATVPPNVLCFLRFFPITLFAALLAPAALGDHGDGATRLIAIACAGLATWRTRQVWVGLVAGGLVFAALKVL